MADIGQLSGSSNHNNLTNLFMKGTDTEHPVSVGTAGNRHEFGGLYSLLRILFTRESILTRDESEDVIF